MRGPVLPFWQVLGEEQDVLPLLKCLPEPVVGGPLVTPSVHHRHKWPYDGPGNVELVGLPNQHEVAAGVK